LKKAERAGDSKKSRTVWEEVASKSGETSSVLTFPINTQIALRHRALGRGTGFGMRVPGDPAYTVSKTHPHALAIIGGEKDCVRYFRPIECERLFGFQDGYTDIPGSTETDRYSVIGNSMAVPVMRWIGERIELGESAMQTEPLFADAAE
jgi:DNA (cytosine-5)-methyltransferase 1